MYVPSISWLAISTCRKSGIAAVVILLQFFPAILQGAEAQVSLGI